MATTTNLLESLGDGNAPHVWSEFVFRYGPRLDRVIRRHGFSEQDTEDIVQDTLLKIYRYVGSFDRTRARSRAWIKMIRRQCETDFLRKRREFGELIDEPIAKEVGDELEAAYLQEKIDEAIDNLKERMPDNHRVFELVVRQGLGKSEAAQETGKTEAAVFQSLYRFRQGLRRELERLGVDL